MRDVRFPRRSSWIVLLLIGLTPVDASPNAPMWGIARKSTFPAINDSTEKPDAVAVWACWYEGAKIHRMPFSTHTGALRAAGVGRTFAGAVQQTPFGDEWLRFRKSDRDTTWLWIPLAYCRRVAPENAGGGDLPIGSERIGRYDGLPFDYRPSDLVAVPERYCYNDLPQRLRAEALAACTEMIDAARRESKLRIEVLSTFRSARNQAYLCGKKIATAGISQGEVARPGHSEHQLGTTVDFVTDGARHLLRREFGDTKEGRWLRENCRRFGFVMTYTAERAAREGCTIEPWHFRYVGRENLGKFQSDWLGNR